MCSHICMRPASHASSTLRKYSSKSIRRQPGQMQNGGQACCACALGIQSLTCTQCMRNVLLAWLAIPPRMCAADDSLQPVKALTRRKESFTPPPQVQEDDKSRRHAWHALCVHVDCLLVDKQAGSTCVNLCQAGRTPGMRSTCQRLQDRWELYFTTF